MKELVEKIIAMGEQFAVESKKSAEGNKAAGARARKLSLEIEKLMKEYRKVSVEAAK